MSNDEKGIYNSYYDMIISNREKINRNEKFDIIRDIMLWVSILTLLIGQFVLSFKVNELKKKVEQQNNINEYLLNRLEGYHG